MQKMKRFVFSGICFVSTFALSCNYFYAILMESTRRTHNEKILFAFCNNHYFSQLL